MTNDTENDIRSRLLVIFRRPGVCARPRSMHSTCPDLLTHLQKPRNLRPTNGRYVHREPADQDLSPVRATGQRLASIFVRL